MQIAQADAFLYKDGDRENDSLPYRQAVKTGQSWYDVVTPSQRQTPDSRRATDFALTVAVSAGTADSRATPAASRALQSSRQ